VTSDRLAFRTFLITLSLLGAGCGAKRPVTSHPPATSQPAPAPEESATAAKNNPPTSPPSPAPGKRSKTPPLPAPVGYTEQGNASWYGVPFNGRRSSNGEIYDMGKLTAAHRTLPFETIVRVTNLNNGKTTTVRITDRGPFVDNRIIDLSQAAAREIESIGPGVVPVRLEVLGNVDVNAGFFTVQVGAFRDRANADRLRDRLSASYSPIFIQQYDLPDGAFYRVRVGKISGEDAAQQYADQLRSKEGFTPFVVRLDEAAPAGVK
jgi:rare lipoprotein A